VNLRGAVQIFDLVYSTRARLAQESEPLATDDWMQATAGYFRGMPKVTACAA